MTLLKKDDWSSRGFGGITGLVTPRLIISVAGHQKTGKTHFAFGAPDPIAYLSLDSGDEGVSEKFTNGSIARKTVHKKEYKIPAFRKRDKSAIQSESKEVWEELREDYLFALKNARTVILDTETEAWELCRLAAFGKVDQIKPHHYGPVNREYKEVIIKSAYEASCNVVLLQRLKRLYVDDKATGNYEQAGFSGIPFDVQVNARTYINNAGVFSIMIEDTRHNAFFRARSFPLLSNHPEELEAITGMYPQCADVIFSPELSFSTVARLLLPDSDPMMWM